MLNQCQIDTAFSLREEAAQLNHELGLLREMLEQERRDPTETERCWLEAVVARMNYIEGDLGMIEADPMGDTDMTMQNKSFLPEPSSQTAVDDGDTRGQGSHPDVIGASVGLPNSSKRAWRSLGEFCGAVIRNGIDGHTDPRLLSQRAAGMNELIGSEGGFAVPTDFGREIIQKAYETGQILTLVDKISVSGNGLTLPAFDETSRTDGNRWGGVTAYWEAEGNQATATKPKLRANEMRLKKLFALIYLTSELMEDAPALEQYVRKVLQKEIIFKVENSIVNGLGSFEPLGVMNASCLVSVSRDTASHIRYADVVGIWARCHCPSRLNSVWLINQDVEPDLLSLYAPGDNTTSIGVGTAYLPPNGLSQKPYGTLMGRPVIPVEYMQTLGTSGDICLFNGEDYLLIDKLGGIDIAGSIHLRFDYDEYALRAIFRCNGMPKWSAGLTPFKGSNSLSPFVTLS